MVKKREADRVRPPGHGIKACKNCGHGVAIHHGTAVRHLVAPCNYPGCKCKDYVPQSVGTQ